MPHNLHRPKIGRVAFRRPPGSDEKDDALEACSVWLARNAELEQLIGRWQQLETTLVRDQAWLEQNESQRRASPKASELNDLDERIAVLHRQNQALAARLPKRVASTSQGLVSKLSVVLANVRAEENKAAHDLIRSVLRDLEELSQSPERRAFGGKI